MCVHLSCGDSTFTYTGLDLNILYYCTMLLMSHIPLAPIWATAICLISRNALAFSSQRTMTSPRGPLSPSLDNLKKKNMVVLPFACRQDVMRAWHISFSFIPLSPRLSVIPEILNQTKVIKWCWWNKEAWRASWSAVIREDCSLFPRAGQEVNSPLAVANMLSHQVLPYMLYYKNEE